jgi:hypothetical protein
MAYTTINKSTDYFDTKLYTGNGSTQTISGVGHQPDMTWVKVRSETGGHRLADAVRGYTKYIFPNGTDAEGTSTTNITSWNSDGFALGNGSINENTRTYASWNWKANGAGVTNSDGNIDSTVSVNQTAGFSIVKWNGTTNNKTIGHGLGVVPEMVIAKDTGNSGSNWIVYHKDCSSGYYLKLNLTNAQDNANSYFTADPTNSILSLTGNTAMNGSGNVMIAYCFAEKTGYSKFGSYTGNGNSDGTFVYTGFKPAFVIQKNTSATQGWQLQDNKRLGYNPNNYLLQPHDSAAESALQRIDLLSNGFKVRTTDAGQNASGNNYIYMAFAAAPLVGTNNVPCTAR